jgi:ABC-type oligopeptide transport system ATPase subunit
MAGSPPPARDETLRFLRLIWQAGEVRELRVPKHNTYRSTASGYFETPDALAAAAGPFDGRANVFLTLNPVLPALLARANNRTNERAENTTADAEIQKRCWLLLDIDPVRPSGISSTEDERKAAREVLDRVVGFLNGSGWPRPITAMSGNGYYALYRVDLPNDLASTALLRGVLAALAHRFNSEHVRIDTSVYNAARIVGLVGTLKVKGENMPERPHRRSELLSVPEEVLVVAEAQLAHLISATEEPSRNRSAGKISGRPLADLLQEAGIEYREQPADAQGFTWYHVRQCPFHEDGRAFECGVGQKLPDGPYAGKCFHNRGADKHWQEWKLALGLVPASATRLVTPSNRGLTRAKDGAEWSFSEASEQVSLWGDGDQCLWSMGETLMIVGPQGVGKTTLGQQLIRARVGLTSGLLGLPVIAGRKVLYVAADRPKQASRSWRRMVTEDEAAVLRERLVVWPGPLPFDIGNEPDRLVEFCYEHNVDTVIIDGLKDIALDLSKDAVGSRVNHALQLCLASGIEVACLYWPRKATPENRKPRTLADVYGSTWITAGMGSVVLLWGEPGDSVVEMDHLKQPMEAVGPLKLLHDHARGVTSVIDRFDLVAMVGTPSGLSVLEAARGITGKSDPDRNQIERARRALQGLVRRGLAVEVEGSRGGGRERRESRFFRRESNHEPTESNHAADLLGQTRTVVAIRNHAGPEPNTRASDSDIETNHERKHANHGEGNHDPAPLFREGGRCGADEEWMEVVTA